jgi:hypothetical protein
MSNVQWINWSQYCFLTVFKLMENSTLCLVLGKAHRGQLWEGKQTKNSVEKNWKEEQWCQTFNHYIIAKPFNCWKNDMF